MSPLDGDLASFVADLPVSRRAATLAAAAHDGQTRQVDGSPFIVHPLEVAMTLHTAGYRDEAITVSESLPLPDDTMPRALLCAEP